MEGTGHENLFGAPYLRFETPHIDGDMVADDIQEILRHVDSSMITRVLDAPCGHGRHANRLAGMGFDVVGVDACAEFVDRARRDAEAQGVRVNYEHLDLRSLARVEEFDMAFCWYGSFGYYDDDTDFDILRRYYAALRPGGQFVLDLQSPYRMIPHFLAGKGEAIFRTESRGDHMFDVFTVDALHSRYHGKRLSTDPLLPDGWFTVRMFTAPEITHWLIRAGFNSVAVRGDDGPFTVLSRRMIVEALKE